MHDDEIRFASPSRDSAGSMPLGNGDLGINVWVEEDGDLLLYLAKTDAWDENGRLLKVGRVRLAFAPALYRPGQPFAQTLNLEEGTVEIAAGADPAAVRLRIWVDAHRPVVRIEGQSGVPVELRVTSEVWRTAERDLAPQESHCAIGLRSKDGREHAFPDTVLPGDGRSLAWCHHNPTSVWRGTLEHQGMAEWIEHASDPLLHRTFGALVAGPELENETDTVLRSVRPLTGFVVSIHLLTAQVGSPGRWRELIAARRAQDDAVPLADAFRAHAGWWREFWARSFIRAGGCPEAEKVSQAYRQQRFLNACAGRGAFPVKFNGSLFTADWREDNEPDDADYRRWGGGYWFQNTRLSYWPMIMAGDFDLLEPWFAMYLAMLPFAEARTRRYFGHGGAFFPETMAFWGAYLNQNYGYDRTGKQPGDVENEYIRRYWQGGLELLAVMLDTYATTRDAAFLHGRLLPLARPILRFYREHYPRRDDAGKILFAPAQSLETWHIAVNPAPEIAGLQWVLDNLLALPDGMLEPTDREAWRELRGLLPPLPTRTYFWEKKTEVIDALQYDLSSNSENPALYTVFPYRIFGVGKPDLAIGRETFARRRFKDTGCWRQDAIQAALLGLADDARRDVVTNAGNTHPKARFPGFLAHSFDWTPDIDQGGVIMIALQRMLMQCDGDRILLLPAWPREWDVSFKLHAPGNTTVECDVRNGRIERLAVTPPERKGDVVVHADPGKG
jgi:hypothetical protein